MFTRTILGTLVMSAAMLSNSANAQDLNAYMANSIANTNSMLNSAVAAQNNIVAQAQNRVGQNVQAGMNNPQLQMQYQAYYQQSMATGRAPMSFAQYVYQSQYTRNFSADGIAYAQGNENNLRQQEYAAVMGMRQAEKNRGIAQGQLMNSYAAQAWERGNMLAGNSTYNGGQYGGSQVLPHTWGTNTNQYYNGSNYRVDGSGQYYQQGSNGYWYEVNR